MKKFQTLKSKPLQNQSELIWQDRQYGSNKREFGENQIHGILGTFSFDRDAHNATEKYYKDAFKKYYAGPDLNGGKNNKKRVQTANTNHRRLLTEIINEESKNPLNYKIGSSVTKFIPANKIALVKNPPISYQSLYATRLATTAKESKNLIV